MDFEDSFSYNIIGEFFSLDIRPHVVNKKDIVHFLKNIDKEKAHKKICLIYGPGPGHPRDYQDEFILIKKVLKRSNIFHVGICLGHQLLLMAMGHEVIKSSLPTHGQKVQLKIPQWEHVFCSDDRGKNIWVQRYNSLVVKRNEKINGPKHFWYDEQNEIMASYWDFGLTYQFHPESIGTDSPKTFFAPIKEIVYNLSNG